MKTLQLGQGSPEWHAHRAQHWNASDAPAMLGVSPYKTRSQLLHELATGVVPEIDDETQRRFDDGHRFEAMARPVAERIIGEELYPCTGTEGKFSASFDGLTMLGDTGFEHKSPNAELLLIMGRADHTGADLPEVYRVQMEHQCIVSGAHRVLFMVSSWNGDQLQEEHHCWYTPDPALRARIIAGWEQFERDLADYVPKPATAPAIARPVEGFGTLSLRIEGRVLASNLDAFKAGAEAFIAALPKPGELQTDQDFADADAAVKACAEAEARIKAAKDSAQAQMADIDAAFRLADMLAESIRAARLALDKAVKAEKESRKASIVSAGVESLRSHLHAINATLGAHAIPMPASAAGAIGGSIKGLRTLISITDAVSTTVANLKIEASQAAERVRTNIAVLDEEAMGFATLFPDKVALCCSKAPDDLRNLARARIADHRRAELAKQAAAAAALQASLGNDASAAAEPTTAAPSPLAAPATSSAGAARTPVRIKLGDINARIAPLSITADGLAQLGFRAVGTERAAKLYNGADFQAICEKLIATIANAKLMKAAA